MIRASLLVRGDVQGVGFRPFTVRRCLHHRLGGWVCNAPDGVRLEIEGDSEAVDRFVAELRAAPPPIRVRELQREDVEALGETVFRIAASLRGGAPAPVIPPDLASCDACMAEVLDPSARRSHYPFTTCTACGPRYTIFEAFPFDRERTAMRAFPLCDACLAEYTDPQDRRYHAQAIACAACGPRLRVSGSAGSDPIAAAAAALAAGRIVAVKGLGGFQLLVDARDDAAICRLRARKRRPAKPLALMFRSLDALGEACAVSPAEATLLRGAAAPIVLLRPRPGAGLAPSLHPGVPRTGAMLPTTPLHALLLEAFGGPVVCTSGNRSNEPICTDGDEAADRLGDIADTVLDHDRPVLRPVDDSVARVVDGHPLLLRRARGYAPQPVPLPAGGPPILALGAHLKSVVGLGLDHAAVLSPHVGDLDDQLTVQRFEEVAAELCRSFDVQPAAVACDLHPDYASTRHAERLADEWGVPLVHVQHHHAHVAAVAAEHELTGPVLGFAWDGVGFGSDGSAWGGEALLLPTIGSFERVAHLRPFRLPGGDAAAREPARIALALLAELEQEGPIDGADDVRARAVDVLGPGAVPVLMQMPHRGVRSPFTTAMGRLFDGVAFLAGLRGRCSFEAQAAMELEALAERGLAAGPITPYPLPLRAGAPAVIDWGPLVRAALTDGKAGVEPQVIAARFHAALIETVAETADQFPNAAVAVAGGCFANGVLLSGVTARLAESGRAVFASRSVPPGDGGIALGQLAVARAQGAAAS